MLDALRRKVSGWLVKGLFVILAFSFVLWGIPQDFTGFGPGPLATVGKNGVTQDEFQQAYQNQISAIARQSGQRLTPEQARAFGLDQTVLSRLVNSAAIENQAEDMKLALSDEAIVKGVEKDPEFQGVNGAFSRQEFAGLLRNAGMSEQAFLAGRRKDELTQQLVGALTNGVVTPQPLVDLVHSHREETRTIAHFTIDAAKAIQAGEPNEPMIEQTYEQNKSRFMTPEYRHLAVLLLRRDDVKDRAPVTDEEIAAAYEQEKDTYDEPERRRIQQIGFKDAGAAQEAKKAIDGGKPFTDVAKEQGASLEDIDLGVLTRKDLIDPKIAETAFAIEKDKVSDVIEGRIATVILRVVEIQPGTRKTLEDVKEQVRDKLFQMKAKTVIQELVDEIEDARGAGKTLKETAEGKKAGFVDLAAVDRDNKTPDGKPAFEVDKAVADAVLKAGFAASVGTETDAVALPGDGYAWVDLVSREEPKQKPLDQVRDEVVKLAIESETARRLSELGGKIVERLQAGETMEALSKEFGGGSVDTSPGVKRATAPRGLTEAAVRQAFGLALNGAATAPTEDNKSRAVFKVTEIKPAPALTDEQSGAIAQELSQQLNNDAITAYLDALKARHGVSINEAALKRAIGVTAQ